MRAALLLVILAACSRPAAQRAAPEPSASVPVVPVASSTAPIPSAPPPAPVKPPANLLDGFELRVIQTPCFGPCPVYSVHLDASGHLKAGRTQATERAAGTVSQGDLLRLAQAFYDAGFFALDDVYPAAATDASTTYLELHSGGRVKKVKHDHSNRNAPKALLDLEKLVEDVTHAAGHGALQPTPCPGNCGEPPKPF